MACLETHFFLVAFVYCWLGQVRYKLCKDFGLDLSHDPSHMLPVRQLLRVLPPEAAKLHRELQKAEHPYGRRAFRVLPHGGSLQGHAPWRNMSEACVAHGPGVTGPRPEACFLLWWWSQETPKMELLGDAGELDARRMSGLSGIDPGTS